MKWSLTLTLSLILASQAMARFEVLGDAAKDLYDLIPLKPVLGENIPTNWTGVKLFGDVLCRVRDQNNYKCLLPNKSQNDLIQLGPESSEMFFNALNAKGLTTFNLGASGSIACGRVVDPIEPNAPSYFCTIAL